MKTNHTPGPWHFSGNHLKSASATFMSDVVATLTNVSNGDDLSLIASAPDLLAALIECEAMLDEFDANSERTQRIRAAIAKARGDA